MKVTPTEISDVLLIEPDVHTDERGYFFESFNQRRFNKATGLNVSFVQDNHSKSQRGVLRGLHYQSAPFEQGKLVRVVAGEVFDVAVDIRNQSPTYGQWVGRYLSAENFRQLWIPAGFAHGFLTISDEAEFLYKTTNHYASSYEKSLLWNDPEIGIEWPISTPPIVSEKDAFGDAFSAPDQFELKQKSS